MYSNRNYTTERLGVDVLPEMQDAVRTAAAHRGLSVNAYMRRALTSALVLDGLSVPPATADQPIRVTTMRGSRVEDLPVRVSVRDGRRSFR